MNVFEAVRENGITTRQATEYCGIKINRNGMAVCPFHKDKNLSMDGFRKAVKAAMGGVSSGGSGTDGYTKIIRGGAEADGCPADGDEPPEQRGHFLQQNKMWRLRELVRLEGMAFQR